MPINVQLLAKKRVVFFTITTSNSNNSPQTSSQSNEENEQITISDEVSYLGQSVDFWVVTPETGRDITGSFFGTCNGTISGKYEGGERGTINGSAKGKCGASIFSLNLTAFFKGKFYLSKNQVELEWEVLEPIKNAGSAVLNF